MRRDCSSHTFLERNAYSRFYVMFLLHTRVVDVTVIISLFEANRDSQSEFAMALIDNRLF